MIRRLIARLRRPSRTPVTFEDWRRWQDEEFRKRLRKGGS